MGTLAMSNLLILASMGLSLIPVGRQVYQTAKSSPFTAPAGSRVVIMGARLVNDRPTPVYAKRLQRALALAHSQTERPYRYLLVGGITPGNRQTEAGVGRDYLIAGGIGRARIDVEERSRQTLENLKLARPLLADASEPVTLISSRAHLARCATLARGLGLDCRLCGAEERFHLTMTSVGQVVKEAYYLHWYHVGRHWSRLTRNRKSLARIS